MNDPDVDWREVIAGWREDVKHAEERLDEAKAEVIESERYLVWLRNVLTNLEKAHPAAATTSAKAGE